MEALIAALQQIEPWHWFVLGLALLIAEIFTGTTYLLWPAAAAAITGVSAWATPYGVVTQLVVFAGLTLILTATGHFYVRGRWLQPKVGVLNDRAKAMIGQTGVADAPFAAGYGRVRVGDSVWRGASDEAIAAGDRVEILAVSGATLQVKRAA